MKFLLKKVFYNTILVLSYFTKSCWSGVKIVFSKILLFWHSQKYFRYTVGILFIIYGFIALVTPVLPGAWFAFIGLELLGVKILFWERLRAWFYKSATYLWQKKSSITRSDLKLVFYTTLILIFKTQAEKVAEVIITKSS